MSAPPKVAMATRPAPMATPKRVMPRSAVWIAALPFEDAADDAEDAAEEAWLEIDEAPDCAAEESDEIADESEAESEDAADEADWPMDEVALSREDEADEAAEDTDEAAEDADEATEEATEDADETADEADEATDEAIEVADETADDAEAEADAGGGAVSTGPTPNCWELEVSPPVVMVTAKLAAGWRLAGTVISIRPLLRSTLLARVAALPLEGLRAIVPVPD